MAKAFYFTGIVLSVVFLFIGTYYLGEIETVRFYDYVSYDFDFSYDSFSSRSSIRELTFEGATWSLFFFLFFLAINLLGLIKVKTVTSKVLSIIGICITGIFLLWNEVTMFSDGGISYDEVFPGYVFYCFIMLAFSIVGLVQSVRYSKRGRVSPSVISPDQKDLLDS